MDQYDKYAVMVSMWPQDTQPLVEPYEIPQSLQDQAVNVLRGLDQDPTTALHETEILKA